MKKLILSLTLLLSCASSIFAKTGENQYYSIVLVSEDESMGTVSGSYEAIRVDQPIVKDAYPKRGYKFTEWTSVKGLSTELAEGNDTLIAHFEALPSYELVFLTSDSTKGVITESKVLYYQDEELKNDNVTCLPGWSFDGWLSRNGGLVGYANNIDTLIAHFTEYTETKRVGFYVNDYVNFFGNILIPDISSYEDSMVVTNKRTGEKNFYAYFHRFELNYGDTLLVSPETANGWKLDNPEEDLIIKCDSVEDLTFVASVVTDTIELEEAVGDSFTVTVAINDYFYDTTYLKVAKGETVDLFFTTPLGGHFQGMDHYFLEWDNQLYRLTEHEFTINVVNDVFLKFVVPETTAVKPMDADPVELEAIVNVYDRNGRLLKRNVAWNEALNGLRKGLYIVGRKKVIVW